MTRVVSVLFPGLVSCLTSSSTSVGERNVGSSFGCTPYGIWYGPLCGVSLACLALICLWALIICPCVNGILYELYWPGAVVGEAWSAAPPARLSYRFFSSNRSHTGRPPFISFMDYKLATSRHPAKAVGHLAQSRGADGDGGGTAGTPPVGVGAIGVSNSQICESPLLPASQRSAGRTKGNPRPNMIAGSSPEPDSCAGAPPNGSGTKPDARSRAPRIRLKDRRFKLATWNMCGRVANRDGKLVPKAPFVEQLMLLEKLDLLVLTETHAEDIGLSRGRVVLGSTSLPEARAGVAIIAHSNGGWTCDEQVTLISGFALLLHVSHRVSRESFWLLGVYADNTGGINSLVDFYVELRKCLSAFVASLPRGVWSGCVAAGDWNFVEHPGDRSPMSLPNPRVDLLLEVFSDVAALCSFRDAAGCGPCPRGWTYSKNTARHRTFSRLDRVYIPHDGWAAEPPYVLSTNWSDHRVVISDLIVTDPTVQVAVPAPRLPDLDGLSKSKVFWPSILVAWRDMTRDGRVTLERWSAFKETVLREGLAERTSFRRKTARYWRDAVRKEELAPGEIWDAVRGLAKHERPPKVREPKKWGTAVPGYDVPSAPRRCFRPSPSSPWQVPVLTHPPREETAHVTSGKARPSDKTVADMLDDKASALRQNALRKMRRMAEKHTSEWYNLSLNKEVDERGSRASVSVAGLRRPTEELARSDLRHMAGVSRDYFKELHKLEPLTEDRTQAQEALLLEICDTYGRLPGLVDFEVGPFTDEEVLALQGKMPNTAPGPDGIPYKFWKRLRAMLQGLEAGPDPPPAFWSVFRDVANDVRTRGSSRCGFKDANVSLFYKKGDPTLVSNYRPISSMNTDCKMYTNLVNARLAPWAVSKIHDDQIGFVPGRLMSDHTRLAQAVAHMCGSTGTAGYLVSLDQAKAYDRVDQSWLLRVMKAMGLPRCLVGMIQDVLPNCRSRVRINSGYSEWFKLKRGVRQGDPLSCLLFNFSIEPLAMRLRQVVQGISIGGLRPAKVMLYADDVNLFLSTSDDVPLLSSCLVDTSFAIGSKFNLDKTDVKPLGPADFVQACFDEQTMGGALLPGAYVLPPGDPLRVLGVWVASLDLAAPRWAQIARHNARLMGQWRAIGASVQNRALLAKALLQSRCYHLLDGNGIPSSALRKMSQQIQNFVRGSFSTMPFDTLAAPLTEGGLNCPSLHHRKEAYDLRFLSHLVSGPQRVLWKEWTWAGLRAASSTNKSAKITGLNPFVQRAYTRPSSLEPRLRQAFMTVKKYGLDLRCQAPPLNVKWAMPAFYHPATPLGASQRGGRCLLVHESPLVGELVDVRDKDAACRLCSTARRAVRRKLLRINWAPKPLIRTYSESAVIWPAMDSPLGCVRVFTKPYSLLARRTDAVRTARGLGRSNVLAYDNSLRTEPLAQKPVCGGVIHVWTDGSAANNGKENCTAGAGWISDLEIYDCVSLVGIPMTNNIAEVAAVALCLSAWRGYNVVVHTDSTYVLGLMRGGLLAMERDGWGDFPRVGQSASSLPLFKHVLFLLRSHAGSVEFVKAKAHKGDAWNNRADFLANEGRVAGRPYDLWTLVTPDGWVDHQPVLAHQPLSYLTDLVVRESVLPPLSSWKSSRFCDRWVVSMARIFGVYLDVDTYAPAVWTINVPVGFRETLWREMNGAQAIGHRYKGKHDLLRTCPCGAELSLDHILLGCVRYDLSALEQVMHDRLEEVSPRLYHKSLHPDSWKPSPWYPLLALKRVEQGSVKPTKAMLKPDRAFSDSRKAREWVIGSFFWAVWKWRMKEANEPGFRLLPERQVDTLRTLLTDGDGAVTAAMPGIGGRPRPLIPAGDLSKLPPPVSHILGEGGGARLSVKDGNNGTRLSRKGMSILQALTMPDVV